MIVLAVGDYAFGPIGDKIWIKYSCLTLARSYVCRWCRVNMINIVVEQLLWGSLHEPVSILH